MASLVILSVHWLHGGYAEEHYVNVLQDTRGIVEEGRAIGAKDFFIGGDINTELKLHTGSQDFELWDSVDWYGLWTEVWRSGEDAIAYDQKLRWLQLLMVFYGTVTSTWVDVDHPGECHTWRAWGIPHPQEAN